MQQVRRRRARLWVSSCDYSQDVSISENILKQVSDAYRRFRNTFRFLLGNLNDFTPDDFVEDWDALEPLDSGPSCASRSCSPMWRRLMSLTASTASTGPYTIT